MTVVLDLETGQVLHAVEGRSSDDLKPFFKRLKAAHAKLRAVAMDMWPAYLLAAAEELPNVPVVHDRYHIVALANEAIDETRREICGALSKEDQKQLKGARFLLLKGGERLDEQGLCYLSRLESLNQSLYRGYLLKEDLRRLWTMPSKRKGKRFLNSWIRRAKASELKQFVKLAKTLDRHRRGVLAYFNHRITTGPLEGLNNKIKVLKRQAYGFRDNEYFKLRLAFIHEDTPAFAG
jgi:transposase